MAEEERNRAKAELLKQEEELASAQRERDSIRTKLVMLERKIIVGGENLLEKAEEQVICRRYLQKILCIGMLNWL